jgi:hypothetical protein
MNLDMIAAERAQEVVKRTSAPKKDSASELDNTVTKTLGVLQEDGVYAAFLFLLSRPAKEAARAKIVREEMLELLKAIGFAWVGDRPATAEQVLSYLTSKVTGDAGENALERLMLAKETLEQMLVYARYGAKAWGQEP